MATKNPIWLPKISKNLIYQGIPLKLVSEGFLTEYEFGFEISKFEMADWIWLPKISKNSIYQRISLKLWT